jgi:hypothetical protein
MNWWAVVAVASSAMKAYGTYMQGMATKAYYDAQADISLLQYKEKRIEAKEKGIEALELTNQTLSAIIAKGAAGGMLTNEGSVMVNQLVTLRSGSEDYGLAGINQELIQNLGIVEFTNLKTAGSMAKKFGIMNAIFGLGTDIGSMGMTGAFDKKPVITKTNTEKYTVKGGSNWQPPK